MTGLPYAVDIGSLNKVPKGKLPYVIDDGEAIGDSTFIRWHLEKKYNIDFDRELSTEQRGVAWSVEKMLEEHLYWALVHARWMDNANFDKGRAPSFANYRPPSDSSCFP